MNVDHFSWIDTEDIRAGRYASKSAHQRASEKTPRSQSTLLSATPFHSETNQNIAKKKHHQLLDELLEEFQGLPKSSKINKDDFIVINVSPSVVPTYYPSIRVYTYNSTALATAAYIPAGGGARGSGTLSQYDLEADPTETEQFVIHPIQGSRKRYDPSGVPLFLFPVDSDFVPRLSLRINKELDCRLAKYRNKKPCRLKKPRYANETSPSRMNTLWTPLGYSQVSCFSFSNSFPYSNPIYIHLPLCD